jgi:hypothetical protein
MDKRYLEEKGNIVGIVLGAKPLKIYPLEGITNKHPAAISAAG